MFNYILRHECQEDLSTRQFYIARCNINNLQSKISSYNCLPSTTELYEALISHTQILVFNSQDRNKGLGYRTKSLIWTEKASSKQD